MNNFEQMMAFRVIKYAVINQILGPGQDDKFRAVGYPLPNTGAAAILNNNRAVSFYYEKGNFGGSEFSPTHNADFSIELFVSADAKADLKVLERDFPPELQQAAYKTAIAAMEMAEERVDFLMDDLIDRIFQLIMASENHQLGVDRLEPSIRLGIGNRKISKVVKGDMVKDTKTASLVTKRAFMDLTCKFKENVTGETPLSEVNAGALFCVNLEIDGDVDLEDNQKTKAGVLVDNTE